MEEDNCFLCFSWYSKKNAIFMDQQKILELLYPRQNPYPLLDLSSLPVLAIIGYRFLSGDIKDKSALLALRDDRELSAKTYVAFKSGLEQNRLYCTRTLLALIGYRKGKRGHSKKRYTEAFREFIQTERLRIKHNPAQGFYQRNTMTEGKLSFHLCLGAFFIRYAYHDVEAFADVFAGQAGQIGKECSPILFMRHLFNGMHAAFWPYDPSFTEERALLGTHAGDYLALVSKKAGMQADTIDSIFSMVITGMRVDARKEETKKKESKPRGYGRYQLGLYPAL